MKERIIRVELWQGDIMANKLVTIRHFYYSGLTSEAELARIKLEANGIQCFLSRKNILLMFWFYPSAGPGIKLQVKESDAERALEILDADTQVVLNETEDEDLKP